MAGISGLILFQVHPYDIPMISLTLFIFWILSSLIKKRIDWHLLKHCLVFALVSLPSIIYYFWLSTSHFVTIERFVQASSLIYTPSILAFILGYGFILPLSLIGIYIFLKKKFSSFPLLIAWLITHIALLSFPLPLQRRMTEGLHLILCIFAVEGIWIIYKNFNLKRHKIFWVIIFVFLFNFSNVFILKRDATYFKQQNLSFPKELITSMQWLKANSPEQTNIISNTDMLVNNLIPAFVVRKIYFGHRIETLNSQKKEKEVLHFFQTNNDDQKKYFFLKDKKIDYVFINKTNKIFIKLKKKNI